MSENESSREIHPAPWELRGSGYVFIYRLPSSFSRKNGWIPQHLEPAFRGGFGAVILADYAETPVGPYREALFIPGSFHLNRGEERPHHAHSLYSVSRILVSSTASVVNGRANWGLPKEHADFELRRISGHEREFSVTIGGSRILSMRIHEGWLPVPIETTIFPLHFFQDRDGRRYYTSLQGRGNGRLAKLNSVRVDPQYFPDVGRFRPFAAVYLKSFHLKFPVPQVVELPH